MQSVWCLQSMTLSCVTWWRDWKVVHVNNLSFLVPISWLFPKLKYCLKPLLSVSVQFLLIQWFINQQSASDIMHPPKVIEGTCMIQTSTNNPLSQEKKWINAAAPKMTWALARAHWHNNRDIQLRMLMTPLCLASRAALVFCKPGLHCRLAGCKHSRRYGRLRKLLLMLNVPLGAPWLTGQLLAHGRINNESVHQITPASFWIENHSEALHLCVWQY